MNSDNIWRDLYRKGIRQIKLTWRAGGDDGGIESISMFPDTLAVSKDMKEELREIVWDYMEKDMNIYTTGNFNNEGGMNIKVMEKAPFHVAEAWNEYIDYEGDGVTYDEEKEDYDGLDPQMTEIDDIELPEFA